MNDFFQIFTNLTMFVHGPSLKTYWFDSAEITGLSALSFLAEREQLPDQVSFAGYELCS